MPLSPSKINTFLFFKLPAAYIAGVRVRDVNKSSCVVSVKHKWINQNPFKSMFWAVQGMAAELATGALVMQKIREYGKPISMLVLANNARFYKKATGKIIFTCKDGDSLDAAVHKAIQTGVGQTIWMHAVGTNENGIVVAEFNFEWTLKLKEPSD
ncbi:DUF4442 domain-containing protein [Bizionia sediminis]|uniref:DUF4442 domain-containing protein n=1 Tax=Bizionia sediminis TaxID=1737064 RepID=A0ABW5KNG1_9FLAO